MARLNAPDLQLQDVCRVLLVLHAGMSLVERQLVGETWYLPQAPALAADLKTLDEVPQPTTLGLSLTGEAAQLGAAYVLVGSRLGARTIARTLAARFGPERVNDFAYYGSAALQAAPQQWAALIARLQGCEATPDFEAEATRAAASVFALLITLCSQPSSDFNPAAVQELQATFEDAGAIEIVDALVDDLARQQQLVAQALEQQNLQTL